MWSHTTTVFRMRMDGWMGDERMDVPLTAGFTANGSKAINHNLFSMFVVDSIASHLFTD